jgi:AraC-like DNA-binding protein
VLRALRRAAGAPSLPLRPLSWAELAAAGGYSDQAHLANEFRALCGLSPTQFLTRSVSVSSKTAA